MTFDLYIPFLLVKHHNFSKQKFVDQLTFSTKKQPGGGREYDKESDKGVHVHFWAPRQNAATSGVTVGPVGFLWENLLKPKLPGRRDSQNHPF